jgi:hypothetical protein
MRSKATTVKEYLDELPEDRCKALSQVRSTIRKNLPRGFEEVMNWGMICYQVPLKTFPDTYNKQPLMYAALASQKNHMAVYLSCIYSDSKQRNWFETAYKASGKRLDMGKSCVRFRKLEDLPLELIGDAVSRVDLKEFLSHYKEAKKR